MTFQTSMAATEFIERISAICPCKPSPPNAAVPGSSTQIPYAHTKGPIVGQESHGAASRDLLTESHALSLPVAGQSQHQPMAPRKIQHPGYPTPQCSDDHIFSTSQNTSTLPAEFSLPVRTQSTVALRPHPHAITQTNFISSTDDISVTQPLIANLERSSAAGPTSDKQETLYPPFNQRANTNTNGLARSRTISSSFESNVAGLTDLTQCPETHLSTEPGHRVQEPQLPATGDVHKSKRSAPAKSKKPPAATPIQHVVPETPSKSSDPLIESLYEACNLDHLPPDELEKLIAHVIREDGFARLVRWSSLLAGVSAFTLTHRTADNGF